MSNRPNGIDTSGTTRRKYLARIAIGGISLSTLPGITVANDSPKAANREKVASKWRSWENKHGDFQQYITSKQERELGTTWKVGCQFEDGTVEYITYRTSDGNEFIIEIGGMTIKETVTESDRQKMKQELASKKPHHDKARKGGKN